MSTAASWRNAIPRRMYRERRQLKSREHLGLLEKKRDYKRRAKDFHSKQNVIKKLAEKALQRNPDEFYHKMVNTQVKDGELQILSKDNKDTQKRRKLDEQKDITLVNLRRMVEKNKAEKIQNNLHMIDFPKQNQHIFFVADKNQIKNEGKSKQVDDLFEQERQKQQQQQDGFSFDDQEDGDEILRFQSLTISNPIPPVKFGEDNVKPQKDTQPRQKYQSEKEKYMLQLKINQAVNKQQYKKLADSMVKEQQFSRVQEALILDKHIKDKGKKRKVEDKDTGRTHFKWFSERKR